MKIHITNTLKNITDNIIKKEGYNIEIDIKTTLLNIEKDKIEIHYTIIDSNNNYEYIIEMSEVK